MANLEGFRVRFSAGVSKIIRLPSSTDAVNGVPTMCSNSFSGKQ